METLRPLPPDRTLEQLRNHYQVEKRIAARLKAADVASRKALYSTMYDELFSRVPDHPRLGQRADRSLTHTINAAKWRMLRGHVDNARVFVEFAPGDCAFVAEVADRFDRAYGIDISDQRAPDCAWPDNCELIVYDGYDTERVPDGSVDLVFSNQFIEHLHPTETRNHFALAHRLLRSGGYYVFCTPHYFTGPHDISAYFSDEPEGFHLKEWTIRELDVLLRDVGYKDTRAYWSKKGLKVPMPGPYVYLVEKLLGAVPKRLARKPAHLLLPSILMAARKA